MSPPTVMPLIDLVNLTDFMSVHSILSAFEVDRLDYCIDAVRKENARNFSHKQR